MKNTSRRSRNNPNPLRQDWIDKWYEAGKAEASHFPDVEERLRYLRASWLRSGGLIAGDADLLEKAYRDGRAASVRSKTRKNPSRVARKSLKQLRARKNPSRRSATPQIYVVDLASYSAGRSRGGWVDLTGISDAEGLSEAIREVVGDADEVAVHDYEHFPNMGESPSLDDVVRIAALMSDHDPVLVKCVYGYDPTIDRVESLLEGGYGEYDDEEDFARSFVEDNGFGSVGKDAVNFHFDVEAYGRDAQMNGEEMPDDDMSDEEFGEYLIREHYGDDVSTMDPATQAMYFDYEGFGRDLVTDYTTIECGRKLFVFSED